MSSAPPHQSHQQHRQHRNSQHRSLVSFFIFLTAFIPSYLPSCVRARPRFSIGDLSCFFPSLSLCFLTFSLIPGVMVASMTPPPKKPQRTTLRFSKSWRRHARNKWLIATAAIQYGRLCVETCHVSRTSYQSCSSIVDQPHDLGLAKCGTVS